MDGLDHKIISLLQQDGRASNAEIAREAGVSEGTIRRRLKRLIEEQFIKVIALMDPGKMGYSSEALIGIQVEPDRLDDVASQLAALEEIGWVAVITGSYDIFAWATLPSSEELGTFLRTKVGSISGIRRTETFVNLEVKKRGHGASMM
ncbi:MAG: Lrp/AsnC family transcriptional regulator [Chloroflexi bacterium]|nr:Lrp/AsnC family transcriptional regulator [Chloroflexota bacterium]